MDNPADCRFCEDGYCMHTDKSCKKICRLAIKRYPELSFADHFLLYTKRKAAYLEGFIKWGALLISLVAVLISAWGAFIKEADKLLP